MDDDLLTWLLLVKKNRGKPLVVMDAMFFFRVWRLAWTTPGNIGKLQALAKKIAEKAKKP